MKTEAAEKWEAKNDLPHEEYMDDHGIHFSTLPKQIKEVIVAFDKVYEKALADGFVDEKEETEIFQESEKIKALIMKENKEIDNSNNGGNGLLGFLFGLALGALGGAAASKSSSS
ncbi:hypothetical protein [Parvicella tangerina]|uniref:Uncharacterized protein n=1 Tax=Parvicella tangerina TaxID=2829795 RepID=A0A916JQH0_9FLAO|nr:hypothetical protein [Parvicella tangerina]CAG5086815.1 hypothetical protein CRYO30217_03292 [Parvicella tangerina]